MTLRLAFRNLFRNLRRTGIVVTAVAVGLAGCMLSMAINYGMVVQMVDAAIATELGHLQVHAPGYEKDPELDVLLPEGGREVLGALEDLGPGLRFAPRVRAQGLVNSPRASVGVDVVGVDPVLERSVSRVPAALVEGKWLEKGSRRVVLGRDLARRLEVGIGDKVVVSVADLGGDLTGQAYRVAGLFSTSSRELDQSALYLPLHEAQTLLGLGDSVSEVVVHLDDESRLSGVRDALVARLDGRAEVRTWRELRPVLVYLLESFDSIAWFLYAAVFVAMAFGIANVLLMAVYERTREIGMLMAVGMSRSRIMAEVVLESVLVTLMGLVLGMALALVGTAALHDGIDLSFWSAGLSMLGVGSRIVPVLRGADLWIPSIVALVSATIASAWPAYRAVSTLPAAALRHV